MTDPALRVEALLRPATQAEITEGLERNPGSRRLRDRDWRPLWFEARVLHDDDAEVEHLHSLIWHEPGRDLQEVAEEELGHGLEEVLRNLRDMEGMDVWPEDVTRRAIRVEPEPA